jgi:hypothetical protein
VSHSFCHSDAPYEKPAMSRQTKLVTASNSKGVVRQLVDAL